MRSTALAAYVAISEIICYNLEKGGEDYAKTDRCDTAGTM